MVSPGAVVHVSASSMTSLSAKAAQADTHNETLVTNFLNDFVEIMRWIS